jgi:hypothetical protein
LIHEITIAASAVALAGASILEVACLTKRERGTASALVALGFAALGGRLAYLVATGDTGRLSMWGTVPILLIALGRVLSTSATIRTKT